MNKRSFSLVCAAVALTAGMAQAADGAKPMDGKAYKHLDTDGDKRISRDEAKGHAMLSKHFDEMDDDKDGFLNAKEVRSFAKAHKGKGFDKLDKNDDKVLTRDEVANHPKMAKRFDAADTNQDGKVTPQEAKAYRQNHQK